MIDCAAVYQMFQDRGIRFYTGVPDSLLKDLCACIADRNSDGTSNVIAANEGGAVAIAAGHHLATGRIPLVYMQNSGQGNALNPLVSLADPEVYGIPLLLIIGWRGEPGEKDEPQHSKQGNVTLPLLDVLGIPYEVFPAGLDDVSAALHRATNWMKERSGPFAFVVRKGTFAPYAAEKASPNPYAVSRESAIRSLVAHLDQQDVVVCTTGKASRELFECRKAAKVGHGKDFLVVGSMGHASQIAAGIALATPQRIVWCLDGDGALIMHMGSLAVIGQYQPAQFKHIVLNNGAHDSVGGQPTAGFDIDIPAIARACGYRWAARAETLSDLDVGIEEARRVGGPLLLEVRISCGARSNLGRPTTTPAENKQVFMKSLRP
jgi:phosphonopyruvate decarboxylase